MFKSLVSFDSTYKILCPGENWNVQRSVFLVHCSLLKGMLIFQNAGRWKAAGWLADVPKQ
jgi:hypothetical protein